MKANSKPDRTRGIVASLAAGAVLIAPAFAGNLAGNTDQVAAINVGPYLIQPSETHPGYMLPPLSDHLLVARLDDDQFAVEQDNVAFEDDDGTATQYNRGYYREPEQPAAFVFVPTTIEAFELTNASDDATAPQYDRGYYKEPEIIVAYIMVLNEDQQ